MHPTTITQQHVIGAVQLYRAAGIPTLLKGAPGSGKSTFVRSMCEVNGWHLHKELGSLKDPTDVAGMPTRSPEGIVWELPRWVNEVVRVSSDGRVVVVFLDELNTAPPSTLAAYLEVVLERRVLDTYLGDTVYFIAAINDVGDAAGGWDLPAAMANRFGHLDWVADAQTVANGLAGNWQQAEALAVPADWQKRREHHAGLVGAFLVARPELVQQVPANEIDKGRAWPSPRTWSWVVDDLTLAEATNASAEVRMLGVTGLVGNGAGAELLTYLDNLDLPDPEHLLADPSSFVLPTAGDQRHAVLMSVAAAVGAKNTPKRWAAGMQVLVEAHRQGGGDVAAAVADSYTKKMPKGATPPVEVGEFLRIMEMVGPRETPS